MIFLSIMYCGLFLLSSYILPIYSEITHIAVNWIPANNVIVTIIDVQPFMIGNFATYATIPYINNNIDNPIIPNIMPAFPNLLPIFFIDFAPNTIANIPAGNEIYQKVESTIDTIPNVSEATGIPDLFLSITFSSILFSRPPRRGRPDRPQRRNRVPSPELPLPGRRVRCAAGYLLYHCARRERGHRGQDRCGQDRPGGPAAAHLQRAGRHPVCGRQGREHPVHPFCARCLRLCSTGQLPLLGYHRPQHRLWRG